MGSRRGLLVALLGVLLACGDSGGTGAGDPATLLRGRAGAAGVTPLGSAPSASAALQNLGQALFYDKVLSGTRDIACSTCHSPVYHTTDLLALSIGTGGEGLAAARRLGTGTFSSRNAPDLFNRGHTEWRRLFWDGRVERTAGGFATPAGAALPAGLASPLAAQALFPMLARAEMRGVAGSSGLADLPDTEPGMIWDSLAARVTALPGYDALAQAAFPGRQPPALSIADLANALAAFVGTRWHFADTPFDRFLEGDDAALSPEALRGGLLFFGRARCSACHRGPLLTDQEFHNVGVPNLGPGLDGGPDLGRARVTGAEADRYAFRTPSLRGVAHSPPYMHNGAYRTLTEAVRHYRDVRAALFGFSATGMDPRLAPSLDLSPAGLADVAATLDPLVRQPVRLSGADLADLVAFLLALTDPRSNVLLGDIPATVPSGLPVNDY
ncbi:MAG: cytochrome c peroxidase [Gemmatimonadota bacterium]|nr:cytochrome c peroxidase [Gemmatimonadota bacterium]